MAAIRTQTYFQSIRQFRCTNCGGEITLINAHTRYVGCQYCGVMADARSEAHQIITKLNEPSKFPPRSFIRLGMIAVFNGIHYQVLGRTCWTSVYKEFWKDEDGSGYSDETWTYDEWLLMSEHRTYFYLIEDAEGYAISTSIIPSQPNLPVSQKLRNFASGSSVQVQEYGYSTVTYFEGESTYQIHTGNQVEFAEYRTGGKSYIVETRLDANRVPKEIEFFEETDISRNALLDAFTGNPEVDKMVQQREMRRTGNKFWRNIFGYAGILFLILLFYSLSSGKQLFQQEFTVPQAVDSTQISDTPELLTLIRPFEVPSGVIRLSLAATLPNNSDAWVGLELRDPQGQVANVFEDDFFHESGTEYWQEDGESGWEDWEESEKEKEAYYRLDEPAVYSGKVYVIPNPKGDVRVRFAVYQESMLSRYFMLAAILCGLAFAITIIAGIKDWRSQ